MWLIDENLNVRLHQILNELGIKAQTATYAGFKGMENGELLSAAKKAGFTAILTRDNLYAQDSGFLSGVSVDIGIVVIEVRVPQDTLLTWFRQQFATNPIMPVPGKVVTWP